MTTKKKDAAKEAAAKETEKKDTGTNVAKEEREDVVGTAANPKPPEPGSVGKNDGTKSNVEDEPGIKTNVREGAGIADGNERIGLADGTVGTRDDLKPGATIIGEEGSVNGTALDREPTPAEPGALQPAQLNPSPTVDPVINSLFGANQAPSPKDPNIAEAGTTIGDEAPGFTPEDERFVGVDPELLVGIKAAISRVNTAREHGHTTAANAALDDLYEALGPIDAGTVSKLREWADGERDALIKERDKAEKKAARDAKKANDGK